MASSRRVPLWMTMRGKKVFFSLLIIFLFLSQIAIAGPKLSYDQQNNRYMAVYTKAGEYKGEVWIYGQLRNGNGTAYGPEFIIISGAYNGGSSPVAQDPVNGNFLVVGTDYSARILGQLVTAQGTLVGQSFPP